MPTVPGSFSNTQYNQISTPYSTLYPSDPSKPSPLPTAVIEEHNFKTALLSVCPSLTGKRVLDLACGNGHFSFRLLQWGASEVVGCDISEGMVAIAKAEAQAMGVHDRIKFVIGDATAESLNVDDSIDHDGGGQFDIVTSAWLLNYAADTDTMTKIWRNMARNLRPGGVVVCLTIPPILTSHPAEADLMNAAFAKDGAWGKYGNRGRVLREAESGQGYVVRYELGFVEKGDDIAEFDCFFLRKECFERSCSQADAFEGLEWADFSIPEEVKNDVDKSVGYWNDVTLWPHCRVCVARKRT